MKPSYPFWPRGLVAGALLAAFLIVPVFVVMMVDAAAGTDRLAASANGQFVQFQHSFQLRATSAFFDGKLGVQAVLSHRFVSARPEDGHDPLASRASDPASSRLRLRLQNRSDANLEVEIVHVETTLGAFNAHPDRLILAPGQSANIDSLVPEQKIRSRTIPVEVALRLAGDVESQQLVLNNRSLAQAGN